MTVYTVKEAAPILKIAECTLIKMLKAEKIRSVRAGSKWLIPVEAIAEFLNGK